MRELDIFLLELVSVFYILAGSLGLISEKPRESNVGSLS
jgi:hypothetical protein